MPLHHRLPSLLVIVGLCYAKVRTSPPEVQTPDGTFRGQTLTSHSGQEYAAYRGIPYALPPTGDRRFALPVRHPVIEGVFDATKLGSVCLQYAPGGPIGQEDCLFLNVFTPLRSQETEGDELKKVFVFIHGGGLVVGSADAYLPGDFVTRGNTIVVTLNYRLNWLGFLRGNSAHVPGNQGHWDQLLALQWVRDNIRSFGGDPYDVTISGESAGAISASILSVSPLANGLFSKAVLLSGSGYIQPTIPRTSNDFLQKAANKFGCGQDSVNGNEESIIKCLKQLPGETFVAEFDFESLVGSTSWGDDLLPQSYNKLMNDSDYLTQVGFYNRDYLVSFTRDDGYVFISSRLGKIDPTSREDSVQGVSKWLPFPRHIIGSIIEEYNKIYDNPDTAMTILLTDISFLNCSLKFMEVFAEQQRTNPRDSKRNVYLVSFDHSPRYFPGQKMPHALDLVYLFDLNAKNFIETFYDTDLEHEFYEEDRKLKGDFIDLLAAFIKTGNPNTETLKGNGVYWWPFDAEKKSYLSFSLQPTTGEDVFKSRRYIWETLVPQWLQDQQHSEARQEL